MAAAILHRAALKLRILMQHKVRCHALVDGLVKDKFGLEIGGPSQVFSRKQMPIYHSVGRLDNCDFSQQTTWAKHGEEYAFDKTKASGRNFFCDGSDLSVIPDATYDFVLSSHNLEHFANPVRGIKEWQRVTKRGGSLILVLPHYKYTFDHRRVPTPVAHMLRDYEQGTPETDLIHLDEILENHDLSRDPGAGSLETFRRRSLANFENRCLHHHVFDEENTRDLLMSLGMEVLAVEFAWPFNLFAVAKMQ